MHHALVLRVDELSATDRTVRADAGADGVGLIEARACLLRESAAGSGAVIVLPLKLTGQGPVAQKLAGTIFQRSSWRRAVLHGRDALRDPADQASALLVVNLQSAAALIESRQVLWLDVRAGGEREE